MPCHRPEIRFPPTSTRPLKPLLIQSHRCEKAFPSQSKNPLKRSPILSQLAISSPPPAMAAPMSQPSGPMEPSTLTRVPPSSPRPPSKPPEPVIISPMLPRPPSASPSSPVPPVAEPSRPLMLPRMLPRFSVAPVTLTTCPITFKVPPPWVSLLKVSMVLPRFIIVWPNSLPIKSSTVVMPPVTAPPQSPFTRAVMVPKRSVITSVTPSLVATPKALLSFEAISGALFCTCAQTLLKPS